MDSRTQEKVSNWIQLLHKHPAHLHALDIKHAQPQRDPGIKLLAGMSMNNFTDRYIVKRNKLRNQITLLRVQAEDGVAFFLDKVEETINACDNLLLTWGTHCTPLGDRKVKETMYKTVTRILEEIEQWKENTSTDDTLSSFTSVEIFFEGIHEMNHVILRKEEDAATEFPSILRLLIKKINIAGNNPLIQQWWYDVMPSRPPTLPKNEEKYREEILDRVEEGWLDEDWARTMTHLIKDLLQQNFTSTRNPTSTRVSHVNEGIQWIRMEELGKALTNKCRAVREL